MSQPRKYLIESVKSEVIAGENFEVHNSDCLEMMQRLASNTVDLILTDPPYNLGKFMKSRNTGVFRMRDNHFVSSGWDDLEYVKWADHMKQFFDESYRLVKPRGSLVIFMSLIKLETIINLATQAGFYYKTVGIWHKTNPMPRNMNLSFVNSTEAWVYFVKDAATGKFNNNGKLIHDFFETSLTPASEKKHGKHPTQKPIKLLKNVVSLLSDEGDLVLDPFMGSGSTAVAASQLNRRVIGSELDSKYFKIIQSRLEGLER